MEVGCPVKVENRGGCRLGKACGWKEVKLDCVWFGDDDSRWILVFRCFWLKQSVGQQ